MMSSWNLNNYRCDSWVWNPLSRYPMNSHGDTVMRWWFHATFKSMTWPSEIQNSTRSIGVHLEQCYSEHENKTQKWRPDPWSVIHLLFAEGLRMRHAVFFDDLPPGYKDRTISPDTGTVPLPHVRISLDSPGVSEPQYSTWSGLNDVHVPVWGCSRYHGAWFRLDNR